MFNLEVFDVYDILSSVRVLRSIKHIDIRGQETKKNAHTTYVTYETLDIIKLANDSMV